MPIPTTSRPWRILLDGPQTGARNMAVDAAVLRAVEAGEAPPTLRLYGWSPWCVSLGHFQKPERELNAEALRARGWDFVIRPTGGRAVLHAEELTYSILARRDAAPWCATLAASYDRIGAAWAETLEGFGLDMVEGRRTADGGRRGGNGLVVAGEDIHSTLPSVPRPQPAPPCFVSSARAELAHDGRKVVGSAQRRTRGAFVQHGSIPLTPDHERLVEALRLDEPGRALWRETLRAHAVSLGEIAPLPPDADRAAWERSLAERLLRALGVPGGIGALTPDEETFAAEREREHGERQGELLATSS
jgi:lipoyl(octanoyl) transferase